MAIPVLKEDPIEEKPNRSWSLGSALERARRFSSLELPTRRQREGLRIGAKAKLWFLNGRDKRGELMWVEVLGVTGDPGEPPTYCGRLLTFPLVVAGLRRGEIVTFGPDHVADVG